MSPSLKDGRFEMSDGYNEEKPVRTVLDLYLDKTETIYTHFAALQVTLNVNKNSFVTGEEIVLTISATLVRW